MGRKPTHATLIIVIVMVVGTMFGVFLYAWVGDRVVAGAYRGESIGLLNSLVTSYVKSGPTNRTLEDCLDKGRTVFTSVLFVWVMMCFVALVLARFPRVTEAPRRFFDEATSPFNLALFRVVLFTYLFLHFCRMDLARYAAIPANLRVAPTGLGWLLDYVPFDAGILNVAQLAYVVFCLTAAIGFFTRTSACLVAILGLYVLGVPQFFYKVNHLHHLVWFPAILAASRCGDVLSADAAIHAWTRTESGSTAPPSPSREYAVPLRFVWLLIGVIYFFPGFWKLTNGGLDWIISDNLQHIMHKTWSRFPDWVPFFRIDQYPVLCKSAAAGVVLFELSFLFLILYPKLRALPILGGLAFYAGNTVFLRISFWHLALSYVVFFDWAKIFGTAGRRLYPRALIVAYDRQCDRCRRTIATARAFDLFGRITFVDANDDNAVRDAGITELDRGELKRDMHAFRGGKRYRGYDAYRTIAWRIPVFWPVLLFMYLPLVTTMGRRIYRHAADTRTCAVAPSEPHQDYGAKRSLRLVSAVGGFLFAANVLFGFAGVDRGWPFACYPRFCWLVPPYLDVMTIDVETSTGEIVRLLGTTPPAGISHVRWRWMLRSVLKTDDPRERSNRIKSVWDVLSSGDSGFANAVGLTVYKEWRWTAPERRHDPPFKRELLFESRIGGP